jgi:DHA2 family lincomycin resistance protein-like MFS transporter
VHDIFQRQRRKVDLPSVAMSFVGMATLMYGLSEVLENTLPAICALVVGVCTLGAFIYRQLHCDLPLLDLSPFKNKMFALGICVTLLVMMLESSTSLILPLYFEGACGLGAGVAGLLMIVPLATYAVMDVVSGVISDRYGAWPVVVVGFAFICVGIFALLIFADLRIVTIIVICASVVFFGVGLGYPPTKVAELGALDALLVSNGSAINSCAIQVANSLGQAVFVGMMSAHVGALVHAGAAKSVAYSVAFDQTLLLSMAVGVLGLVLAYVFASRARRSLVKVDRADN